MDAVHIDPAVSLDTARPSPPPRTTYRHGDLRRALLEAGVPAGPLNNIQEALDDPQTAVRAMRIETAGYKGIGSPIKLSETPPSLRRLPPDFGADTDAVLAEAGFTPDEIAAFRKSGGVPEK